MPATAAVTYVSSAARQRRTAAWVALAVALVVLFWVLVTFTLFDPFFFVTAIAAVTLTSRLVRGKWWY